jgi:heme-degrading monooxygenase HmoA
VYVIVWHFQVAVGREDAFEEAYGPGGDWARLFERSNEFQGTELLRAMVEEPLDEDEPRSSGRDYFTIDRWTSREAYAAFSERFGSEYGAMDDRFLELCDIEECLGHFETVA